MLRYLRTLMACTTPLPELSVTSAASTRSVEAPGSEEEPGALHASWCAADYAWDGEELLQVRKCRHKASAGCSERRPSALPRGV